MPFKSQSQRSFMYALKPKMAKEFEKHTTKGTKLPMHVNKKDEEDMKNGFRRKY